MLDRRDSYDDQQKHDHQDVRACRTHHEREVRDLGQGLVYHEFERDRREEECERKLEAIFRPFSRHCKRRKREARDKELKEAKYRIQGLRSLNFQIPLFGFVLLYRETNVRKWLT